MKINSNIVSKEVEVVTTVRKDVKVVTLVLEEREAKMLGCLIGAISPKDAEQLITELSMNFAEWLGKLEDREIIEFTGNLYDGLYEELI